MQIIRNSLDISQGPGTSFTGDRLRRHRRRARGLTQAERGYIIPPIVWWTRARRRMTMYQRTALANRTSYLDRRRLIEARIARDCELLRREIVMLRGGPKQPVVASSRPSRVELG